MRCKSEGWSATCHDCNLDMDAVLISCSDWMCRCNGLYLVDDRRLVRKLDRRGVEADVPRRCEHGSRIAYS